MIRQRNQPATYSELENHLEWKALSASWEQERDESRRGAI